MKQGNIHLLWQAGSRYLVGVLLVAALLFLPAGTLHYRNAWLFLALLFLPMLVLGLVLWLKAPGLLEKRLKSKEERSEQKQGVGVSALMFIGGFVIAGLDHRFQWSKMPLWLAAAASVLLLLAYGLYAEVMRENAYLSRTVEIQEGQKLIDTGLYGIVRHPMYVATTLLFLAIPLVLGSWVAFLLFLLYPVLMVKRIRNEEEVLAQGLDGYKEYQKRVKYRMIPLIW